MSTGFCCECKGTIEMVRKHCAPSRKTLSNCSVAISAAPAPAAMSCNANALFEFFPSSIESSTNAYGTPQWRMHSIAGAQSQCIRLEFAIFNFVVVCWVSVCMCVLMRTCERHYATMDDGKRVSSCACVGSAERKTDKTKDWLTVANWLSRILNARSNGIV